MNFEPEPLPTSNLNNNDVNMGFGFGDDGDFDDVGFSQVYLYEKKSNSLVNHKKK